MNITTSGLRVVDNGTSVRVTCAHCGAAARIELGTPAAVVAYAAVGAAAGALGALLILALVA